VRRRHERRHSHPARAAACALALFLALESAADTLILRNGNRLDGQVVEETPRLLRLKLPYGVLEIPRKEVAEILRTDVVSDLLVQGARLLHHEQFQQALAQFEQAAAHAPRREEVRDALRNALLTHGEFLRRLKRHDEALAAFARAEAAGDDCPRARAAINELNTLKASFMPLRIRAEAACAAGDLDQGLALYRRLADLFPDRSTELEDAIAQAEAQLGDRALDARDFQGAASRYEAALASKPDVFASLANRYTYAQARVAQTLLAEGRNSEGEAVLRRALGFCPQSAALHFLMGRALEALGRLREAVPHFARACPDPNTPFDPEQALAAHGGWAAGEETGAAAAPPPKEAFHPAESAPFIVVCADRSLAAQVTEALDLHFSELAPEFGVRGFAAPCTVTIHPTKERYLEATGVEAWAPARTTWKSQIGRLLVQEINTYRGCPQLLSSVLRHELAHLLLAAALDYPRSIPLWANEGAAVMTEPGFKHAYYRRHLLRAAQQRRLFPIDELLALQAYPSDDRVDVFYAQSHSLVQYLVARASLERFIAFLRELRIAPGWETWKRFYRIGGALQLEREWEEAALAPPARS